MQSMDADRKGLIVNAVAIIAGATVLGLILLAFSPGSGGTFLGGIRSRLASLGSSLPQLERSVPAVPAACSFDSLKTVVDHASPLNEPEDLGYPIGTVDRLDVRSLLLDRSYDRLDSLLTAYTDSARRDFRLEYRFFDAYNAFDVGDIATGAYLDDWVRERPRSGNALLARATHYVAAGWEARGESVRRQTSRDKFVGMREYFQRARSDVDSSLRVMPCNVIGYHLLMRAATTAGDTKMSRALLDQALIIQPYSFLLRARHMYNLVPRWGGSYREMEDFAAESDALVDRNPRLRALHGFPAWDRADVLARQKDTAGALEQFDIALSFGDFWQFRLDRAELYYRLDRYKEALEDLDRAQIQRPQYVEMLDYRSSVEYALGRDATGAEAARLFSQAFRHAELAERLDPTDPRVQETLAFFRKSIPEYASAAPP
jgi:tetratricopeptide (TPR) repeat protein